MLELFRCEPLNAMITKETCERNRARKENPYLNQTRILSCVGCAGVDDSISEVVDMAKVYGLRKGDRFTCPGCGKDRVYEAKGLCAACNRKGKADPAAVEVSATFGKVTNADADQVSFGVESWTLQVIESLDQLWADKRAQFLCDLSGLPVKRQLECLLKMHDAVEGLGY